MKLSCITTVFNEGPLLIGSLQSILKQTYSNFELIIVDDGASESSRDALSEIDDDRILIIRQANAGLSAARNKALEQVTGDFVCFLDADDSRPTWAFQSVADVIARDDPDLVFCRGNLSEINDHLMPFYDEWIFDQLAETCGTKPIDTRRRLENPVLQLLQLIEPQVANKVIRADLIREHRLRFPSGHLFEDIFFHTLAIAAAQRVSILDAMCFTYFRRYQKSQITKSNDDRRFDIIAVTKLTLDLFQHTKLFDDPRHRAAVLASCLRLARWCESMISHHHRYQFRKLLYSVLAMADPRYMAIPVDMGEKFSVLAGAGDYLKELGISEHVGTIQAEG